MVDSFADRISWPCLFLRDRLQNSLGQHYCGLQFLSAKINMLEQVRQSRLYFYTEIMLRVIYFQ